MNVIPAPYFDSRFFDELSSEIKRLGVKRTEFMLLANDYHPSYVKAVIRKVMRERGW